MIAVAMTLVATTVGFGAFSSLMFAWQWVLGPPNQFVASALFVSVAAAATAVVSRVVRRTERVPIRFRVEWIFLLTAVLFTTYWLVRHARMFPYGYTDAWIIWNDHARFFYRDGGRAWLRMFEPERAWFHPDYPMLLPGLIGSLWALLGAERGNVPAVVACGVTLLSIGIVSTATSALSRDHRGVYAGVILLATPTFLLRSASQYADLPLGLYMLTTVVLLAFADAWPTVRTTLLVMGGLSAGMAAWTKNEGLLFACVVLLVQSARALRRSGGTIRRDLGPFLFGLTPMLTLVVAYKTLLVPPSDLARGLSSSGRLLEPDRYVHIITTFVRYARGFGAAWGRYAHPVLLVAAFVALYPPHVRRAVIPDAVRSLLLVSIPLLMLTGYFAVYVFTPYDVTWHMATSLERLYLQVWPMAIFLAASLPILGNEVRPGVGHAASNPVAPVRPALESVPAQDPQDRYQSHPRTR